MKFRIGAVLSVLFLACSTGKDGAGNTPAGAGTAGDGGSPSNSAGSGPTGARGGAQGSSGASSAGSPGGGGTSSNGLAGANGIAGSSAGSPSSSAGTGGGNAGSAGSGTAPRASDLPVPPGPSNLAKPAGTPGNLQVLDWAGFKGAVSYTFDDTNSSQTDHYEELQALGVRYTFYLITNKTAELDNPLWKQAVRDGHEIGNHTRSHEEEDPGGVDTDAATQTLEQKFGVKVYTMAAPYGSSAYVDIARTRFLINRGVASDPLIAPNDASDPFELTCYIPSEDASAAGEMNAEIDAARAEERWRIVLVHGFIGGDDAAYLPVSITEFLANVSYAKAFGDLWIDSVVNVGAYWRGQKTFTSAKPAESGADTVWTWTLPAHFPPGKYLRVRVDGGTLKQNGAPLAWDPHGYYEVALDAGTLTLSP